MRRVVLIVLALVASLAAQKQPEFTKVFSKQEFAERRAKLRAALGKDGVAIVRGREDLPNYVSFRENNEMFYLTGTEAPGSILVVADTSLCPRTPCEAIYMPARDPRRQKFEGALLGPDDASSELAGIPIRPLELFAGTLSYMANNHATVYAPTAPQEVEATSRDLAVRYNLDRMNDPWDGQASREARFIAHIHERFPAMAIRDLTPILDQMRLIKSPQEIAVMRRSSELASLALAEGMRSTMPGQYEYELAALMRFLHNRNGGQGEAYYPLVATGTNAYAPHYHAASAQLKSGDLLLLDSAPDFHYYMSDVTRMWPVNGKFSPQQRELYTFYLGCYRAIISHIRPNASPHTIGQEAARDMEALLQKSKFSNPKHAKAAAKFVSDYKTNSEGTGPYMLGHWVGMSTHDVGGSIDTLKPGMVFTIEPQLTVPEDETYIRLEDMLLVTDTGVEVMSPQSPEDPDAIEKLMQEKGLLKLYPRLLADDVANVK
jgi:Xaa-Pro aminopeptidase